MKKQLVIITLISLLIMPFSAFAGEPLDTIKGHINKVLDVLRDSSLKGESGKSAKKAKIRSISDKMFDYTELSRRTLGQNWNKFNGAQQKEFIELYKSLLEDAYSDKIMTYTDEHVLFTKENMLSEKTCEVQTTIVTKKAEIPIYYRVIKKEDSWKVYDVVIEGVSLINNYRTQFREILSSKSPDELLDILKKKVGKA
ncbi:MAG: ABC transporter substrate-binding protein [Nitrospirae bacterium]|nr:ABC transporter substrate-binding protein [Nitrospirota bacterium]